MQIFKGNGRFDFNIVGEKAYQDALAELAGPKTPEGCDLDCMGCFYFDDGNKYDGNAVAIMIPKVNGQAKHVGYLSRKHAEKFRREVAVFGFDKSTLMMARAKIVGGWKISYFDQGHYGVKLDLLWPLRLRKEGVEMTVAARLIR